MTLRNSALAFAAIVALVVLLVTAPIPSHAFLKAAAGLAVLAGAVTVTFQFPVAGVTPPTLGQQPLLNTVRGLVAATADADTTATITHNMGLTTAQLAAGQPEVTLIPLKTQFYTSTWIAAYTDGNTITLTKGTGGGSGVAGNQLGFFIRRPHSIAI